MCNIYFAQHLGAAYSNRWSKYVFLRFFVLKSQKKSKKFAAKSCIKTSKNKKKAVFLGIKPSTSVLVQTKKPIFCNILQLIYYIIVFFQLLSTKMLEHISQPVFGVCSTQTLVEKYNTYFREHLRTDMQDEKLIFWTTPPNFFLVATCQKNVVGTVAVQKREETGDWGRYDNSSGRGRGGLYFWFENLSAQIRKNFNKKNN